MLYNTLKNYAQQLQWSREFAICLFNLSKLAKNMLRTLLIGYYISDMGYKKTGGKFCAKTFMIIIGANFFIIKSEVQTFIGLIGCSYIFFS